MASIVAFRLQVDGVRAGLQQYLSEHYEVEEIEPIDFPSWNATYMARTRQGGSCLVKVVNEVTGNFRRTTDAYRWAFSQIEALARSGTPLVVAPVHDIHGNLLGQYQGWKVIVLPWIAHRRDEQWIEEGVQSAKVVELAARALAEFHERLTKQRRYWVDDPPQCQTPRRWSIHVRRYCELVERSLASRSEMDARSSALLEEYGEYVKLFVQSNQRFFEEDQEDAVVHGDYRPENIVVRREQPLCIVDYEFVHCGSQMTDVIYAALCFAGKRWLSGPRDRIIYQRFIDTYQNERNRITADAAALMRRLEWVILRAIFASYKREQLLLRTELHQRLKEDGWFSA